MQTITMEAEGLLFDQPLKLTLTATVPPHPRVLPYYMGSAREVRVTHCNGRWSVATDAPSEFECDDGPSWIEGEGKTLQEALDHFMNNVNAVKLWTEWVGRERDESNVK